MKSFFKKIGWGRKRAETILEVLVAIFVVAIGSTASTSLVVDALQSNGLSRDNLIAMNLAVEGQEAMRNIRDSNWLKFSYNRDDCWNMMPGKSVCADADLIQSGNYTPFLNTATMGWELISKSESLELSNTIKQSSNNEYMLYLAEPGGAGTGNSLFVAKDSTLTKTATKFYRMVTISYDAAADKANSMTVTSIVQWNERGVHQVKLVSKLTDYLKIKVN